MHSSPVIPVEVEEVEQYRKNAKRFKKKVRTSEKDSIRTSERISAWRHQRRFGLFEWLQN